MEADSGFEVVRIPLEEWRSRWLPGLDQDGLMVGLNWSDKPCAGYDVAPMDVEADRRRSGRCWESAQ